MSTSVSRSGRHCRSFYRRTDTFVRQNETLTSILGTSSELTELILKEHIERVDITRWSEELAEILSPKNAENGAFFDEFAHMLCFACISADKEEHLKASLTLLPKNVNLMNHELVSVFFILVLLYIH